MQRKAPRKASAVARSQIAESARLAAEPETYFDIETPPRKKFHTTSNNSDQAHRSVDNQAPEWYIAFDFGTTCTTVAWIQRGKPTDQIFTIDNFPGEKQHDQTRRQIPTELWYPKQNAQVSGDIKPRDIRMRFGNEVHRMAEGDEGVDIRKAYDDEDRVTMMKLILDESHYAQASKRRLQETLEKLKAKGCIEKNEDVLFHFFREVFQASKSRLGLDFDTESSVEVTFCVPVCYTASAVAVLGAQVERAMKDVRFGTDGSSPCHIFVVHEAEAQAMQALLESIHELQRGETFVLVDCGGGTTDIGIYRVALTEPLRLGSEILQPMGAMVGAGDLNNSFRNLVKGILRREKYLEIGEDSISTIIEAEVMYKFEYDIKRAFKYNDTEAKYSVRIRGLRKSRFDDRIRDNYLVLSYQDIWGTFRPTIEKIASMMEDAIDNANAAGYAVSKIVVVGGFGDSPCLQSYLAKRTDEIVTKWRQPLRLRFLPRNMSATGVATGAILRAINKAGGPSRIPCQSIGVLRHIPRDEDEVYSPEILAQVNDEREEEDYDDDEIELDEEDLVDEDEMDEAQDDDEGEYVKNTILWIFKKNMTILDSVHTVVFVSEHCFEPNVKKWIIKEQLWSSETCTLDYFKINHPKNTGKVLKIGAVEFDVSGMRQKIRSANIKAGKTANKVVILVEMTVIDRNLEFTARWPATPQGEVIVGSRKFFSIASAFTPGTQ